MKLDDPERPLAGALRQAFPMPDHDEERHERKLLRRHDVKESLR